MTAKPQERDIGVRRAIEAAMRTSNGKAVSILAKHTGDFDLAEDAVQDAWLDATRTWATTGVPENPAGWIIATARRRAIDRIRRRQRSNRISTRLAGEALTRQPLTTEWAADADIPDERLSLLFTCCHPALSRSARIAITLRSVGGLTTREIARAFGVTESTMQQRLVRAKQRIITAGIPFRVPEQYELAERLSSVHEVLLAMFTEGYAATENIDFIRVDLSAEAIRLAALTDDLLPDQAESMGLRALLLLHDARRAGRRDPTGSVVLLLDQDRSLWDSEQIRVATALLDRAARSGQPGPYQVQAAIAALHAEATTAEATDWAQIAALYRRLVDGWPSRGARLAAAVAHGMAAGPDDGVRELAKLSAECDSDHRWHAAIGHFYDMAENHGAADDAFGRAADLAQNPVEAETLRRRIRRQ